ncbi:centromere/kinetochore protein zw10 homolog [Cephus cinctus]|uniref:Centromere/kinetochore protein zw10 homolog n=1 Tax=Cephus cinctus TaxID=211228 RepID=A0AAJ7FJ42_CEPCN|nr:centromere/kinetochore protein zw10 homolog [Cephus cinctus]
MSSFLTNILLTAGNNEKIDLNEKINEIKEQVLNLKYEVKDFMDHNYIEFTPQLKSNETLANKAESLINEMNILQARVEGQIKIELSGSTRELQSLSDALKESSISIKLSSKLLELHNGLRSIETYKQQKRYVDAAKTIRHVQVLLESPDCDLQSVDIFHSIMNEYGQVHSLFLGDISALWQQHISWNAIEEPSKALSVTLTIQCRLEEIQDLIQALHYVENLNNCLNNLAMKLMNHVIRPLINYVCDVHVLDETVFSVKTTDKKNKPCYESVLYNLKLLFQFLHQHLNVTLEGEQKLFAEFRNCLLKPLSDTLIKDCIANTIPSSSAELQKFGPVVKAINEFQDYLIEIGFITDQQLFLSDYTKNIDSLFIDKICQDLLVKARVIMKKDLHDSIKHEPREALQFPEEALDDYGLEINRKLSKVTFQLPACQISKSVQEIMELVRGILEEACSSSEVCSVRLFYTSRNVFEMYAGLVPEHHKKFLETIPQQVALFHNNCMYLAHNLFTLAHKYRRKLPELFKTHNLTYVDLPLLLRTVGIEYFLEHMKYQRNIIIDIIRDSGLSTLGQTPELPPSTERAMRQCIRQLELLRTVWLGVLPVNIYCRAVGCIMNSMVEDLITKVTNAEDIPADVATELVTLLSMIIKRGPSIFPDPDSVQRHVRKWQKLTELIKVLGASLKEIEDRWENGKGPLAREFSNVQVRQLIRALFQNTERRAILLASIK